MDENTELMNNTHTHTHVLIWSVLAGLGHIRTGCWLTLVHGNNVFFLLFFSLVDVTSGPRLEKRKKGEGEKRNRQLWRGLGGFSNR